MAVWTVMRVAVCITVLSVTLLACPASDDYLRKRMEIISEEQEMKIGGRTVLSSGEQIVNGIIMKEKIKLIEESRLNRTSFVPALSFFVSKPLIENTTLFSLIQRMPKGALLHTHELSVASLDWVISNATYRDNVFMCLGNDGFVRFHVFQTPPSNPDCVWKNVSDERAASGDVDEFDERLRRNLSLLAVDPMTSYVDNAHIWTRFSVYFGQLANLINYRPIYEDYYWRMLEEIRSDNVQYVELRTGLAGIFELDGTVHDAEFGVQILQNITKKFVTEFPDFTGAKVIMAGKKQKNVSATLEDVKTAMFLNAKYPDFVAGFDMDGDEDSYHPFIYFLNDLLYPTEQDPPYKLPYFFHAGETIWQDSDTDYNTLDAILLNALRIAHGYSLVNHPKLVQLLKEKDIAVEISPISNQVLRLVSDPRNHAMVPLIAAGFPIVVSSDNYATWEASPMTHDMYITLMTLSGQDVGLAFLKQLAINSIKYSALNCTEKSSAMSLWETKWAEFIAEVVNSK